ncbi:aspartate/glutamate racemase family protein [Siphonobacter sp. BAB-5385]|uniref:aspartate/glutamate racemase family protein n=2 Tax=unclassified Siphonobacter TaxID=2635712 RepID=UPI001C3D8764|nr:amino acid racemase [Siphonobacter sp. BAB-5385]
MVVEQNPQIPDRTAHLLRNEADPTLAMFSTCKQLEAEGAQAIAIPCNTAHAFIEAIQPHLRIPIIHMLHVTIEHIIKQYGKAVKVGLLATSGTIESQVYHEIASKEGLSLLIPEPEFQKEVMASIYGPKGVKAGFSKGQCVEDLTKAIDHLTQRGAEVLILGCTELPLMFPDQTSIVSQGKRVELADPTTLLAKKCVHLALNV